MTEEERRLLTRGRLLLCLHRHGLQRRPNWALRPISSTEVNDSEGVENAVREALRAYTGGPDMTLTFALREVEA